MLKTALVSVLGIVATSALQAQEVPAFTFNVGAGFTEPVHSTGQYLDLGWNTQAGAGFNFNSVLAGMIEFNYNNMGINSTTLSSLGAPGGTVQVWSFTLDPVIHLNPHRGPADFYLTGGGGIYHRSDTLTEPSVGFAPVLTPFGFFNVPVAGDTVLSSYSVNKPGWNAGAGVTFGGKWRAKFYAEARFHRMYTDGGATDFVPVTFGIRF